jgi:hypothetical protein
MMKPKHTTDPLKQLAHLEKYASTYIRKKRRYLRRLELVYKYGKHLPLWMIKLISKP